MPDVKHFDPDAALDRALELFWRQGEATTGVQDVVAATGLSRSSLYTTFGSKRDLHLAALRRYIEQRSQPVFDRLADDGRGLSAVTAFFDALITARCTGAHARWGCMVANTHATGAADGDPELARLLDLHHERLRAALANALRVAARAGQLRPGADPEANADLLALLAYGVNLRSRAGADPASLHASVTTALDQISA